MSTRYHELLHRSTLAGEEQQEGGDTVLDLIYRASTLSAPHLHRSMHFQLDTSHICSSSKNKLYQRTESNALRVADDSSAYYDYFLQNNIEAMNSMLSDTSNTRTFLLQEEHNKDTKFISRLTSIVEGNVMMMLNKMNFVKSSEKEASLVLRVETAEKVIINIMKVFNDDGSHVFKVELVYGIIDGINSQQSNEKIKNLINWIKIE